MISFDPLIYRIADFWEWNSRKELVLSPKYQRRSVWSEKAKSYLIDTLIRGLPLPKIFMRYDVDMNTKKSIKEIIDGQQRTATILSFLNDGFKIMNVHNKEYGGKYFSELSEPVKKLIWEFKISVDVITSGDEPQILDIFARLNTYTVTLNRQELFNSKYFGAFKQAVYSVGFEFKNFWVNNNILTDNQIARMAEAECASELVIQILSGVNDRKVIESYYKKYDDEFLEEENVKDSFRMNIDLISEIIGYTLPKSNFSKKPLFYSLFGVIHELREKNKLNIKVIPKINSALLEIDNILEQKPEDIGQKFFRFYDASTKHVTDLKARKIRHEFLNKYISSKAGL